MTQDDILTGVLLDEVALNLDELACACAVEPNWIVERVEAGLLSNVAAGQITRWQFSSTELARARRLAAVERDFEANPELAALVADLIEEVERLKGRLNAAGLPVSFVELSAPFGHDSFLLDVPALDRVVAGFLNQ